MSEDTRGVRTLPTALLLAFGIWIAMTVARVIFTLTVKEPWTATRFNLTSEGISFAGEVLVLLGALALWRRTSGKAALGMLLVVAAGAGLLTIDLAYTCVQFMEDVWKHEWIFKTLDYAFFGLWLLVPIGLAIANWRERKELAIAVIVISLLSYPPPFLMKAMYSWLPEGKSGYAIHSALHAIRLVSLVIGFAAVARTPAIEDRVVAASGMRLSAKALWLRLIAALMVPLLTLMVIGSNGKGGLEMLKHATFLALLVNIWSVTQFGVGALRSARAQVADFGSWALALGGTASLWAGGVMLSQMPRLFKMLYPNASSSEFSYGGSGDMEFAQALSIAMPLVIIIGMGLIAVAINGLSARSGNEELRAQAQTKAAGFVTLQLVSMAIASWMIPKMMEKSPSMGTFVMLTLLAVGAGVAALVMMAKLLTLAAESLEREPGLPPASIVTGGT